MKREVRIYLISIVFSTIVSCNMGSESIILPGKIVLSKSMDNEYIIYANSNIPTSSFKLVNDLGVEYSGVDWLNTKDAFIGTEGITGLTSSEYRCNIVEFDTLGNMTERIYESKKGEIAWPEYTSWDDKYLILTTHKKADPHLFPFEDLTPMLSLMVIDLEQRKVISKIDSVGRSPNFLIEESPWLHSRYQFIYSIDSGTQVKFQREKESINPAETTEGVYIYDVILNEYRLIVPGGRSAISSPINNQIAYEKENSIRVLDLNTHKERTIYKHSSNEKLRSKHWTPDGKYIYFAYNYFWGIGDMFNTGEKLIEVSTGKEQSFMKIGHGFAPYTWK